jgi:splicing suppressor protein 51
MLFPASIFQIYFIGKEISFPRSKAPSSNSQPSEANPASETAESTRMLPTAWTPTLQLGFKTEKRIIPTDSKYGVPSYYVPYSNRLSITGLKGNFSEVYPYFQGTFDPYTDVFFLFHPGFGFPSSASESDLQISSLSDWGPVVPQLLESKCALFATGFSPVDMERDVRSLDSVEGVSGEFDWVVTPGPNPFGSEKWDVAEFDPRVMVKSNWGIWGIRGKRRDITETYFRL